MFQNLLQLLVRVYMGFDFECLFSNVQHLLLIYIQDELLLIQIIHLLYLVD